MEIIKVEPEIIEPARVDIFRTATVKCREHPLGCYCRRKTHIRMMGESLALCSIDVNPNDSGVRINHEQQVSEWRRPCRICVKAYKFRREHRNDGDDGQVGEDGVEIGLDAVPATIKTSSDQPKIADIRLEVRVKNNILWKKIKSVSKNISEFSQGLGIPAQDVYGLLNLKTSPWGHGGVMKRSARKLVNVFSEEIFPPHLYKNPGIKKLIIEVPFQDLGKMRLTQGPEEAATMLLMSEEVSRTLGTLTDRESRIIKMRFGIGIGYARSLEETGRIFRLSTERVRQIEAKAIRKMRHPARSKRLRDYLK